MIDFHITGFWVDDTFFDSDHGKYLERCGKRLRRCLGVNVSGDEFEGRA